MQTSLPFLRIFFTLLNILLMTTLAFSFGEHPVLRGLVYGVGFSAFLFLLDILLRRFRLLSFNLLLIGLFVGYLMGQGLMLVFNSIIDLSSIATALNMQTIQMIKICLMLASIYIGTLITIKSSQEFHISLPFVKFSPNTEKKKDLIIDASALSDARIIDLAASGILDHQLVIPRFLLKDLYTQSETGAEVTRSKAKRCLETIKKLEELPYLQLRYEISDFSEIVDINQRIIRLARFLDANVLTADISRVQMASIEGIRIINIYHLSNALKPLMQTGEIIKIKIQRYGKEPRQGVGYLDDGTMVVINGGGDYIGETIETQVLSVKHTNSGRMIFCNTCDGEHDPYHEYNEMLHDDK
jgi:uncharacterized protein YacL